MNVRAGASSKAAASSTLAGDLRRQSIVEEDEKSSLSLSGGGALPADADDASASAAVDVLALCKDGLSVLHSVLYFTRLFTKAASDKPLARVRFRKGEKRTLVERATLLFLNSLS